MNRPRPHHRPAARGQPITRSHDALRVLSIAATEPARPETIALLLDDGHVGRTCVVVDETSDADDVLEVARLVAEVAEREVAVHAVVLASIRVDGAEGPLDESGRSDVDRWLELLDLFDGAGVELLDWYVVVEGRTESLRSLTGMPLLWRDAC